jgi:hypothetical protein
MVSVILGIHNGRVRLTRTIPEMEEFLDPFPRESAMENTFVRNISAAFEY